MENIQDFWLFLITGIMLNLTPGADMLFVISRGSQQGFANGLAAVLGIATGALLHLLMALAGISALIAASPQSLRFLQYAGAAYLLWLGFDLIRHSPLTRPDTSSTTTIKADYLKGIVINVLNPKIVLFFVAFLPQFIKTDAPSPGTGLIILGLTFNIVGSGWNCLVAWGSTHLGRILQAHQQVARWYTRIVGLLLIAIAVQLVYARLG